MQRPLRGGSMCKRGGQSPQGRAQPEGPRVEQRAPHRAEKRGRAAGNASSLAQCIDGGARGTQGPLQGSGTAQAYRAVCPGAGHATSWRRLDTHKPKLPLPGAAQIWGGAARTKAGAEEPRREDEASTAGQARRRGATTWWAIHRRPGRRRRRRRTRARSGRGGAAARAARAALSSGRLRLHVHELHHEGNVI